MQVRASPKLTDVTEEVIPWGEEVIGRPQGNFLRLGKGNDRFLPFEIDGVVVLQQAEKSEGILHVLNLQ